MIEALALHDPLVEAEPSPFPGQDGKDGDEFHRHTSGADNESYPIDHTVPSLRNAPMEAARRQLPGPDAPTAIS